MASSFPARGRPFAQLHRCDADHRHFAGGTCFALSRFHWGRRSIARAWRRSAECRRRGLRARGRRGGAGWRLAWRGLRAWRLGARGLGLATVPEPYLPVSGPVDIERRGRWRRQCPGTASNLARPAPLNTVTNSLAGSVTGAASRTTNTLLGPTGNPIGQLGAASRQVSTDPRNRSGVPPAGERRYVAREVVIGLASDISPRVLDDLARRHRLAPIEAQQIALIGTTYHRWRIGDGRSVSDVIRALEADGVVRTAQPNYRFTLAQAPPAAAPPDRGRSIRAGEASSRRGAPFCHRREGSGRGHRLRDRHVASGDRECRGAAATTPRRPGRRITTGPAWPVRSSRGRR